ncbi:MAG TPA: oligosaccharide flippase family protein [Blastocatellia bacterium]
MQASDTIYDKIKKTVKHTLIFGVGSIANSAYGFLLLPLYIRRLRASEYGVLSLLVLTQTLLSIVLKFGLNHAFFRHYYESNDVEHRRRVVGSGLIFLFVASGLAVVLLYPAAGSLSAFVFNGDYGRASLMRLVFITSFFEVMTLIPDSILRVNFKSGRYSALSIAALAVQLVAIAYLVCFVDASANSVMIGRLIGTVFEAVIFFWAVRKALNLSFSMHEVRQMLTFGGPLIFGQLSFTLFMMVDRFFIERYTSDREVGVYALACSIVSVIQILVTVPFGQVWTVMRFSVMNDDGAEEYYSRILTYIVFVSLFFALCISAVAGDVLLLKALKSYWPCATIIPLLALSAAFDTGGRVLNIGTTLRKRTIFAPLVTGMALLFNVALNFVLIPRYGVMGATVSTLISYIVFCGLRYWSSQIFFKVKYEWSRLFMIVTLGGLITLGFYVIDYLRGPEPSHALIYLSILVKGAAALSFPFMLYPAGFYEERERKRIWELAATLTARLRQVALPATARAGISVGATIDDLDESD